MKKRTVVVSAYPCCGKTYAFEHQDKYSILDSDSSSYSWLPVTKEGIKQRNPEFPNNYIAHIKENLGKVDIIFVSSHLQVRQAMKDAGIDFITVYPDIDMRDEWVERMKRRGNDEKFIQFQIENWDNFVNSIAFEPQGFCIVRLGHNEYINVDYLYKLWLMKDAINRSFD